MNNNPTLISVVIPIYNAEKYLERCLRSLFEQTYSNIEYIFVNDCSQDKSMDVLHTVLKDYPLRASHIIEINHLHNMGVAVSRKDGFMASSGDFVASIDSDDWIELNMYEEMLTTAINKHCQLVLCTEYDRDGCVYIWRKSNQIYNNEDLVSDLLLGHIDTSIHYFLFHRSIILTPNFPYPCADMGDDMVLSIAIAYFAKNIEYLPKPFYHYCDNADSITRAPGVFSYLKRAKELKANTDLIISFFEKRGEYEKYLDGLIRLRHAVKVVIWPVLYDKNSYKFWKNTYPELVRIIFKHPSYSNKTKLLYFITYLGLYPLYLRIKNLL